MRRILLAGLAFLLLCSSEAAFARAKVRNEQVGNTLAHTLECQERGDFQVSPLPGFLQILRSTKPVGDITHLPVSNIRQIDELSYGVYITWKAIRMQNGKGFMVTIVFVPKKVLPPKDVMRIVKQALVEGAQKKSLVAE